MQPILCTLFDATYLGKGLALYESLCKYHPEGFLLYTLALDDFTWRILNERHLPHTHLTHVNVLENEFPELRVVKQNRSTAEYCWTLTPFWLKSNLYANEHLTYVDADSFLFASLQTVYAEIQNKSIAIVPHRFPENLKWRTEHNGTYNVNFVHFKDDEVSRKCLDTWAAQCLTWCFQRTEHAVDGSLRFGDQGYLDTWPEKYNAHVIQHLGLNLAPWNQQNYDYLFDRRLYVIQKKQNGPYENVAIARIDPLVLFHFHSFAMHRNRIDYGGYANVLKSEILQYVYKPYAETINRIERALAA